STTQDVSFTGGVATLPNLDPGSYDISATYLASTEFKSSSSNNISQVINTQGTSTTLATRKSPARYGQPAITATVKDNNKATAADTAGTVDFTITNTVTDVQTTQSVTFSGGVATLPNLDPGSYSISAMFEANTKFQGSTSNTIGQVVNKYGSTATL